MTPEEFQKKMLDAQADQKTAVEKLLSDVDRVDKSNKQLIEDFTAAKNAFATTKDLDGVLRKMALMQAGLQREARASFGSPAQRIAHNPEMRRAFMRMFIEKLGLRSYIPGAPILKDLDEANTPGSTMIANNELEKELFDGLLQYGAFRTLDVRAIAAKVTEIRLRSARVACAFVDEAVAIGADATKAGSKLTVTPKKAGTLISISNELMDDDVVGVVQEILDEIFMSFAEKLDWIGFTADGTADSLDGGFTGMFYGGTAAGAIATHVSIATLTSDDFVKCLATVNAATLTRMPKWWMHPTVLAKTFYIKDTTGRPIFQSALEAPSLGAVGSIYGSPVVTVGNAPSTDAISSKIAAFGDPNAQAIRIRKDLSVELSKDFAFDTDEITFRGVGRIASKTKLATSFAVLTTAAA